MSEESEDMFYTWTDSKTKNIVVNKMNQMLSEISISRRPSEISSSLRYKEVQPNISVIDGFYRSDYEYFRPGESLPRKRKDVISACLASYDHNEIVNNVVNLMSELTSQGVRLVHPVKSLERLYNQWFTKIINGPELAEKFVNLLVCSGQPIVNMMTAKIKQSEIKRLKQVYGADFNSLPKDFTLPQYEIPCRYVFLNPLCVDVVSPELGAMGAEVSFCMKIPARTKAIINNPRNDAEKAIVKTLPPNIVEAAKSDNSIIYLDPNKVKAYYYKKRDWDVWAYPMLAPILSDLIQFEKLKLADMAALDGIISYVRIWKLGSLEHKIIPGKAAIAAFNDMIMQHAAGGTIDLVWNPGIELQESSTDIAQVLGMEKYIVCLSNIYSGLGIPPSLTGLGKEGGMTNNFVSTKVLTERLRYLRNALTKFLDEQIALFQKALGLSSPAQVDYDYINLGDETAEKALWVQLFDRDILSVESMQERFGRRPEIERTRIRREYKERERNKLSPKVSPYHDAQPDLSLKKIALQAKLVTPTEVGLELDEKKPGEMSGLDVQLKMNEQKKAAEQKLKGQPGQGRPKNSKDSGQRKQRQEKPRVGKAAFVDRMFWAKSTINPIRHIIFSANEFNSVEDADLARDIVVDIERAAFSALCQLDVVPLDEIEDAFASAEFTTDLVSDAAFTQFLLPLFQQDNLPNEDVIAENVGVVYSMIYDYLNGGDDGED